MSAATMPGTPRAPEAAEAGGGIFQYHERFVGEALQFLGS
jgi:hypothetical protein